MVKLFQTKELIIIAIISSAATAVLMDYVTHTALDFTYQLSSTSTLLPVITGGSVGFVLAMIITQFEDVGVSVRLESR